MEEEVIESESSAEWGNGVSDELLEEISGKMDTVIDQLKALTETVGSIHDWLLVLFFVVAVSLGVVVGYLIGKR
ncbi:hypothetical protein NDK47_27565 (plasmid) [Brevibacillus ruminantium]|uniref:Uncharacterized protein n=1 Tax=Brevibacillus ruminantium TaxID=2950604 RepID=A0ABY4WVE0_9BACL|nr:hypothetical protein [Brevibacillus ruminantium]USG68561.1 hypothetical protein NDK47_27565 [Brevibacillus ruminantium]